jgi:hypothetical protein
LQLRLKRCHPTSTTAVEAQLREAEAQTGATAFDWLVEIIRVHGIGGEEAADNVVLELK